MLQTPAPAAAVGDMCPKHQQQQLFYCSTCRLAICMNCTVLDHDRSNGHTIQDIASVVAELQVQLKENILRAKRAIAQRNAAVEALKMELECLEGSKAKALEKVEVIFENLRSELDKRENLLIQEVHNMYAERKNTIVKTGQMYRSETKQLTTSVVSYEKLAQGKGTRSELVRASGDPILTSLTQPPNGSPPGGYILFLHQHNLQPLMAAINEFGAIDASKDLPSIFKQHVPPLTAAIAATISIKALSSSAVPLNQYPLSAQILDPQEEVVPSSMKFTKDGVYEVTFMPQTYGTHDMQLYFLGHALSGLRSFEVKSNDPVMVIGQAGQNQGQLQRPTSVTTDSRGNIYVADMGNKRVQVFDKDGHYLNQFGLGSTKTTTYDITINHATEELLCTRVTQVQQGSALVDTIRIFSLSGEKKRQIHCEGINNGLFLTINKKGWMIVSDSGNNCVHILSKEGVPIAKFGGEGSKVGRFDFPAAVCIGRNDDIIVVDNKNHRVQVFDLKGKYKGQIGSHGQGKGQFHLPRGVASDQKGNILVADSLNRVQIFREDGQYMATIESTGDPINDPYNLCTSEGHVFVTDFKNHCVKKYKYL